MESKPFAARDTVRRKLDAPLMRSGGVLQTDKHGPIRGKYCVARLVLAAARCGEFAFVVESAAPVVEFDQSARRLIPCGSRRIRAQNGELQDPFLGIEPVESFTDGACGAAIEDV